MYLFSHSITLIANLLFGGISVIGYWILVAGYWSVAKTKAGMLDTGLIVPE